MPVTVGIHIVWTAYGTWLPGDPAKPRHWSPLFDFYGHLRGAGHRLNLPDATTFVRAQSLMNEYPKSLSSQERLVVACELEKHLAPSADGKCLPRSHACAVEPTHVHLLVGPVCEPLDRFVGRLKGRSSSEVVKLLANADRTCTWTAEFWNVFLFDEDAMRVVQRYIQQHNTRAGRPASPFNWLDPI
jgi:hypothetical protein